MKTALELISQLPAGPVRRHYITSIDNPADLLEIRKLAEPLEEDLAADLLKRDVKRACFAARHCASGPLLQQRLEADKRITVRVELLKNPHMPVETLLEKWKALTDGTPHEYPVGLLLCKSATLNAEQFAEVCQRSHSLWYYYIHGMARAYSPSSVKSAVLNYYGADNLHGHYNAFIGSDYPGQEFVAAHLLQAWYERDRFEVPALSRTLTLLLGDSDPQLWALALDLFETSRQSLYEACQTAHLVNGSQMPATWLDPHEDPPVTDQAPAA